MRRYALIWTDKHGTHSCEYTNLDTLLGEVKLFIEINIIRKEFCNYIIEVREYE